MPRKKVNPRRRPATQADVNRARDQAVADAVHLCMAVFFTVLLDKEQADKEILHRVWDEVNDLSDSINQGYVTEADLKRVLREEYDIEIG
jgi:hypothetical protein